MSRSTSQLPRGYMVVIFRMKPSKVRAGRAPLASLAFCLIQYISILRTSIYRQVRLRVVYLDVAIHPWQIFLPKKGVQDIYSIILWCDRAVCRRQNDSGKLLMYYGMLSPRIYGSDRANLAVSSGLATASRLYNLRWPGHQKI